MEKIQDLISKIEKKPIRFWYFFISLVSIACLRQFFETFSDQDNNWQIIPGWAFFHYCLFFISIFFATTLLIKILSGEKVLNVIKAVILFFPIILTPPIIDLLASRGEGTDIAYIFGYKFSKLIDLFFTFFGPLENAEISLGMRIEIIMAGILAAIYIFIKRRNILLSFLSLILVYIISFVYVALPNIIFLLFNIDFTAPIIAWENQYFDKLFSFIFLASILLQLLALLAFYSRQKFWALIKNIRPYRVIHYEAMLIGGFLLGKNIAGLDFHIWHIAAATVSVLLAWISMVGLNDIIDINIDAISNKSRPLIKESIAIKEYKIISFVAALLSLLIAHTVSYPLFIFILVYLILYTVYSIPPIKIKRIPILSTLSIACASLVIIMAGFTLSGDISLISFPGYVVTLVLITFTLSFTVKDVKDFAGDKKSGILTIPVMLGERLGKKAVGLLVFISYLSVPFILPKFFLPLLFISIIFGLISYILINRKNYHEKYIFISYFCYFGFLIYFIRQIYF